MDPVEEQLDAYNARDVERFLACYADDVVVEGATGEVVMSGLDAMRRAYATMFAQAQIHAEVRTRLRAGEWVVDDEWVTDLAFPDREPRHVIAVYRVRDGKIANVRFLR
jgi:hypothetical protein